MAGAELREEGEARAAALRSAAVLALLIRFSLSRFFLL